MGIRNTENTEVCHHWGSTNTKGMATTNSAPPHSSAASASLTLGIVGTPHRVSTLEPMRSGRKDELDDGLSVLELRRRREEAVRTGLWCCRMPTSSSGCTAIHMPQCGLRVLPCLHAATMYSRNTNNNNNSNDDDNKNKNNEGVTYCTGACLGAPHGISDCMSSAIITLDLRSNSLRRLGPQDSRNTAMNNNSTVPHSCVLSSFVNLTTLDVTNNDLETLEGIGALVSLTTLRAARNSIKSLSPLWQSKGIAGLEYLDVSSNSLSSLFSATDIVSLQKINKKAPTSLQLRVLNIAHNVVIRLDQNISVFSRLTTLSASRNQIASVPSSFPSACCNPGLAHLDLSHNALTQACIRGIAARAKGLNGGALFVDVRNNISNNTNKSSDSSCCTAGDKTASSSASKEKNKVSRSHSTKQLKPSVSPRVSTGSTMHRDPSTRSKSASLGTRSASRPLAASSASPSVGKQGSSSARLSKVRSTSNHMAGVRRGGHRSPSLLSATAMKDTSPHRDDGITGNSSNSLSPSPVVTSLFTPNGPSGCVRTQSKSLQKSSKGTSGDADENNITDSSFTREASLPAAASVHDEEADMVMVRDVGTNVRLVNVTNVLQQIGTRKKVSTSTQHPSTRKAELNLCISFQEDCAAAHPPTLILTNITESCTRDAQKRGTLMRHIMSALSWEKASRSGKGKPGTGSRRPTTPTLFMGTTRKASNAAPPLTVCVLHQLEASRSLDLHNPWPYLRWRRDWECLGADCAASLTLTSAYAFVATRKTRCLTQSFAWPHPVQPSWEPPALAAVPDTWDSMYDVVCSAAPHSGVQVSIPALDNTHSDVLLRLCSHQGPLSGKRKMRSVDTQPLSLESTPTPTPPASPPTDYLQLSTNLMRSARRGAKMTNDYVHAQVKLQLTPAPIPIYNEAMPHAGCNDHCGDGAEQDDAMTTDGWPPSSVQSDEYIQIPTATRIAIGVNK